MTKHDSISRFSIRQRDPDEVGMMRQSGSSLVSRVRFVEPASLLSLLPSWQMPCHMVVLGYRALLRHDSRIEFSGRSLASFYLNTVPESPLFPISLSHLPLHLYFN